MTTTVPELVAAAAGGDEAAWVELVRRYTPLVRSVIWQFRLSTADAADVNQTVWLRVVEQLPRLRESAALPGWIVTTTRNECLRVIRLGRRTTSFDPLDTASIADTRDLDQQSVDDALLRAERNQVLRDALAELEPRCQQLIGMLVGDPPASHKEISEKLDIAPGSIGPTRGRCLRKLRNCPSMRRYIGATGASVAKEGRDDAATLGR